MDIFERFGKKAAKWLFAFVIIFSISCTAQTVNIPVQTATNIHQIIATKTNPKAVTKTPIEYPATVAPRIVQNTSNITIVSKSFSPSRRWKALVSRSIVNGKERSIFKVENDIEQIVWIVEDVPFQDVPVAGFSFPEPFYWSNNGQFLYFTHRSSGDGCFGGDIHRSEGLHRLDLATGNVVELSPNLASFMVISPDEKTLAYFDFAREGLTLRDLETGSETNLNQLVKQEEVGMVLDQQYIVWSPDGKFLAYVILAGVCDSIIESHFNWFVAVNVKDGTQKILRERDENGIVPISWVEPDKILARDNQGKLWWLDPVTGNLTSTTP